MTDQTTTADLPPTSTAAVPPKSSWTTRTGLDKYSALYLWAGFMIFFGLTQDSFFTGVTFHQVLSDRAIIVGLIALAFLVPLATNTFDLSIGSVMCLSLCVSITLAKNFHGLPQVVCGLLALLVCLFVGFLNGYVVIKLGVNSFIATLGMSQLVTAFILFQSGNRQISDVLSKSYRNIGITRINWHIWKIPVFGWDLPLYFFYTVIIAVAIWFVFEHMPLGRYLFATGGNREAARLTGVKVDRLTWGTLIASAGIAGFAGIVFSWKTPIFSSSTGPGYLFPAIAAVFFGASQLKGRPNVWGTMIAVYALAFGIKGLQLTFDAGTYWIEPLFEGTSLVVAVAFASRHNIVKLPKRKARA